MSQARAPGKLVLSGAYSVLSGARALVTAVDRYALADSARSAQLVTPEVQAAGVRNPPWFDASALRDGGQKLGLGSSAAILVASLATLALDDAPGLGDAALCAAVYERALSAHRTAQGGGSGVDVAASAHGGVFAARRDDCGLAIEAVSLPIELHFEVWACTAPASTAFFLSRIAELSRREPTLHRTRIGAQAEAAEAAFAALQRGHAQDFVAAIDRQVSTLGELGNAAGLAIVTPELSELAELARAHAAAFLPAGAGGGDVAYYVGLGAPPPAFGARCRELGLSRVELGFGARGVHAYT